MSDQVADLKPRGVKAPLNLVPKALLDMYVATLLKPERRKGYAAVPRQLLEATAAAFHDGATKYEPWNWTQQGDMVDMRDTYTGALLRHVHLLVGGESHALDSGVSHIGHAAACAAILGHHLGYAQMAPTSDGWGLAGLRGDDLLAALARHAHQFADRTVEPGSDCAQLACVVRCLGELARARDVGYDEPTSVREAREVEDAVQLRCAWQTEVEMTMPDGGRISTVFVKAAGDCWRPASTYGLRALRECDRAVAEDGTVIKDRATYANIDPSLVVKEKDRARRKKLVLRRGGAMGVSEDGDIKYLTARRLPDRLGGLGMDEQPEESLPALVVSRKLPVGRHGDLLVVPPGAELHGMCFSAAYKCTRLGAHKGWWVCEVQPRVVSG